MPLHLTAAEERMLSGQDGEGVALAMRVVVGQARISGAPRLVEITSAHVDSCLYHGQVSLDFVHRLVDLGAKVRVPTTLNVGSTDLTHPTLVRDRQLAKAGRELMTAYTELGGMPTFTCAPYQLPNRPALGEHIAWAESNAIVFANSVLGARTDRYGDFLDVCAAITARAPYAGLQTPEARVGTVAFDCRPLGDFLHSELAYPLLGHHIGSIVGAGIPVLTGIPADVTEDDLKAVGAAAASAGGVALFHVVGVTPEAPVSIDDLPVYTVDVRTLQEVRRALSSTGPELDAVSVGTPHASYDECVRLAELVAGPPLHLPFYLSTSRATRDRLGEKLQVLERAGVTVVVDTCTYVTTILQPTWKRVMTNSGKWAHYAPGNINVTAVLGSLAECVASARAGRVVLDP
ncbi:MAG TPA: aconitase X catalytic domain-containing protein [Kribbella sp.]|nr:aconitase X catalytic domain-containing protein [Kribbella sp.]